MSCLKINPDLGPAARKLDTLRTYCVFCKRGQENKVIQILGRLAPSCKVIRMAQQKTVRGSGEGPQMAPALWPQYLFLYSDVAIGKNLHDKYPAGIEYWLGKRENDYELQDEDRKLALALYTGNGMLDDGADKSRPLAPASASSL